MNGRLAACLAASLASCLVWVPLAPGASPAPARMLTGQGAGWPDVRAFDRLGRRAETWAPWGTYPIGFAPYPTYQSGVRVAVGDVTGDGRPEIVTAPGKDAYTELRVFDGTSYRQLNSLLPFGNAAWWAGAFVATGDTGGDDRDEVVVGLDAGCCTTLHVLDAGSGAHLSGFFPYGDRSEVGARVAAADLDGDGKAELLAVPVGGSRVGVYAPAGGAALRTVEPFGTVPTGVSIATGDVTGDSRPELIAAAATGAGVQVRIVDLRTGVTEALLVAFPEQALRLPEVAVADVDGDGGSDIVVLAQTLLGTQVRALDPTGLELGSFFVVDSTVLPGASLAAGDLDGDGAAELVLGSGATSTPWPPVENGPDQRVAVYRLDGARVGGFAAYPGVFQGGVRVALADLDGDRRPELVTAPGSGLEAEIGVFTQQWVESRDRGQRLAHFLAFEPSFRGGANVASGDVDGDGRAEIVVGPGPGRPAEVRVFDSRGGLRSSFLAFEPGYDGGISVAAGDLDADGVAEIVVGALAAPARVRAFARGVAFGPVTSPLPPGTVGAEVAVADLAGTGRGVILAGAATGEHPALAVVVPATGQVLRSLEPVPDAATGIRVAAGDLDDDGRDEIAVTTGRFGDGWVRVLSHRFRQVRSVAVYDFAGTGLNVALATRLGLPIVAEPRTLRLAPGVRTRRIVARFRDAALRRVGSPRATIDWGDGSSWRGVVLDRGRGVYDVRSTKRYEAAGYHSLTVTFTDRRGRVSVARGVAIVRKP